MNLRNIHCQQCSKGPRIVPSCDINPKDRVRSPVTIHSLPLPTRTGPRSAFTATPGLIVLSQSFGKRFGIDSVGTRSRMGSITRSFGEEECLFRRMALRSSGSWRGSHVQCIRSIPRSPRRRCSRRVHVLHGRLRFLLLPAHRSGNSVLPNPRSGA